MEGGVTHVPKGESAEGVLFGYGFEKLEGLFIFALLKGSDPLLGGLFQRLMGGPANGAKTVFALEGLPAFSADKGVML